MRKLKDIINPIFFSCFVREQLFVSKKLGKYGLKKDGRWAVKPFFRRVEFMDGYEDVIFLASNEHYLLVLFYELDTYFAYSDYNELRFYKIREDFNDNLELDYVGDIYEELDGHFKNYLFSLKKGKFYGFYDYESNEILAPRLVSVFNNEVIKIPEAGYKNFIFDTIKVESIKYKFYLQDENTIVVE